MKEAGKNVIINIYGDNNKIYYSSEPKMAKMAIPIIMLVLIIVILIMSRCCPDVLISLLNFASTFMGN